MGCEPTGTYWLYKWYGDMAGNMVTVTPAGSQDGIASYDSTRKIVIPRAAAVIKANHDFI